MTIIHDAILQLAVQLRISNALELIRISADLGWDAETTDRVAHQLHISIQSIFPEENP